MILEREPRNPYDANAIRVLNMEGVQIGHVRRTFAAAFAPVMDDRSDTALTVEACIPHVPLNRFTLPLAVDFYGVPGTPGATLLQRQLHLSQCVSRPPVTAAATRARWWGPVALAAANYACWC